MADEMNKKMGSNPQHENKVDGIAKQKADGKKLTEMGFGPKTVSKEKSKALSGSKIRPGNPSAPDNVPVGINKKRFESDKHANKRINKMFKDTDAATLGIWNHDKRDKLMAEPDKVVFNPKLDITQKLKDMGFEPSAKKANPVHNSGEGKLSEPKAEKTPLDKMTDFENNHPFEVVYDYDDNGNENGYELKFRNPEDQEEYNKLLDEYADSIYEGKSENAKKLKEMGFGPKDEIQKQNEEARQWGDEYYSNPENVKKDITEAVEHTRKLTTDKYGGSYFGSLSVEEVLQDLPERFEQNPELRAQVEEAVEEHNKPYKINEYIGGRPLVTQSGKSYGVEFEDGKLYAGSATNSGIFHDYEIDYDDSKSIDQNLQDLYEKIEEDEASWEDYEEDGD